MVVSRSAGLLNRFRANSDLGTESDVRATWQAAASLLWFGAWLLWNGARWSGGAQRPSTVVVVCTNGIGRLVLSFWIRVLVFFLSSKGNCWSGTPTIGFDEWMAEVVPVCGGGLAVDSWTVVCFGFEGTFNSVLGMLLRWGVLLQWVVLNSGRVGQQQMNFYWIYIPIHRYYFTVETHYLLYCNMLTGFSPL